jgi:hypothetical protein
MSHVMKAGCPQGLKATLCGLHFTARLKSCPFNTRPIQNFASARCFFGASEKQPPIPSTDENARACSLWMTDALLHCCSYVAGAKAPLCFAFSFGTTEVVPLLHSARK